MTRQQAQRLVQRMSLIQAYAAGYDIEFDMCGAWRRCTDPDFICDISSYRIVLPTNLEPKQPNDFY